MSCNAFSFYTNVFSIITGSISLITLAVGFQSYLPSKRIKVLEHLLEDTDQILTSAIEDGLLLEQSFRARAHDRLSALRKDASTLRSCAYCATTWSQDCKGLFMGLSSRIGRTCSKLKELRADIVTSSEAQRRNVGVATLSVNLTGSTTVPTNRSESLDDRTNSDVTSITISQSPEVNPAEDSRCPGKVEICTEAPSDYMSVKSPDYRAERTRGPRLSHNGADQCGSTSIDAVESGTCAQVEQGDNLVPLLYTERPDHSIRNS